MRTIHTDEIIRNVKEMCIEANLHLSEDMEQAIKTGNVQKLRIQDTKDVMDIMTGLRKEWNMKYPGEVW